MRAVGQKGDLIDPPFMRGTRGDSRCWTRSQSRTQPEPSPLASKRPSGLSPRLVTPTR